MRSRVIKSYDNGFLLAADDLRALVKTVTDQFQKTRNPNPEPSFKAWFENGAVADIRGIDEILALDTMGSRAVTAIQVVMDDEPEPPRGRIGAPTRVELKIGATGGRITLDIDARDMDWSFVAVANIDEKIRRIQRRVSPKHILRVGLSLTAFLSGAVIAGSAGFNDGADSVTLNPNWVDKAEQEWREDGTKDEAAFISRLFKTQQSIEHARLKNRVSGSFVLYSVAASIIPAAAAVSYVHYFHSGVNFLWGEYATEYQRRQGFLKSIASVVGIGVILAIIVNIVSGVIGKTWFGL